MRAAPGVSLAAPSLRSWRQTVTRGVLEPVGSRQMKTAHWSTVDVVDDRFAGRAALVGE
jgi:hypothetical protein